MDGNTWHPAGDERLFRAIRQTWDFARRTLHPHFPPGVYKHRTIEEAQRQREHWEQANFEAHQQRLRARRARP